MATATKLHTIIKIALVTSQWIGFLGYRLRTLSIGHSDKTAAQNCRIIAN